MRRSRRAAAPADPYERTKAAVEALCPDKRQDEFDEALLAELKALVKADEASLVVAFNTLQSVIGSESSWGRLQGLELANVFFQRSKAFRDLFVDWIQDFVEKAVGSSLDVPLPPPREAAEKLRQRAVALLRAWDDDFGRHYPVLRLAVRATAGAVAAPLPAAHDPSSAADEERRRRQERTQQILREKYESIRFELPADLDNTELLLAELRECLAVAAPRASAPAATAAAAAAGGGGGDDDDQWEDVPIGDDAAAATAAAAAEAASRADMSTQKQQPARVGSNDSSAAPAVPPEVLRESMTRLLKALKRRYVPSLVEAIPVLSKVDANDARRTNLLQRALAVKTGLEEASRLCAALPGMSPSVCLLFAPEPTSPDAAGAPRLPIVDPTYRVPLQPSEWEQAASSGGAGPSRTQSQTTTAAAAGPQQQRSGGKDKKPVDEEAARRRAELLARAPVIPAGPWMELWEEGGGTRGRINHGMEIPGHWGRIDHDGIMKLDSSMLAYRCSYYEPPKVDKGASGSQQAPPRAADGSKAKAAGAAAAQQQGAAASGPGGAAGGSSAARGAAGGGGGSGAAASAAAAGGSSGGAARTQRAADTAHNTAMLASLAGGGLVEALGEEEARAVQAAANGGQQADGGEGGRKRKREKKPPSLRERLIAQEKKERATIPRR